MAQVSASSRTKLTEANSGERTSLDRHPQPSRQQSTLSTLSSKSTSKQIPRTHRKVIFCDPVAFRYLEEDESTIVVDRGARIQGYELYIVEQWVCSRTHPTFVICTYTGDPSHSILVSILAIPIDEKKWSQRLKVYFQAVSQFHAREQDTARGTFYVTNLSSFPSALTVISVPDGDIKKHKEDLIVNENLKRMGCAGRAAISLSDPPASTIAKYYHLYATSEAVPIKTSVTELVRLCQLALVLYGKLNSTYADGLLCDITERSVGDWWDDIGTEFHNVEPSDGIFGPTTVVALLGLLAGAHNRLKSYGITVGKDVFDVDSTKRSIGHFQKASKINKTRRFDRETLDRLHRSTAKIASGDGWAVPRAVKSTVAELSGKGGEMVMGMVGAKDKVGIAEVETLDIERFAQLVPGGRLKWIWQGKSIKSALGESLGRQVDDARSRGINTGEDGHLLRPNKVHAPKVEEGIDEPLSGHNIGERKLGRLRDAVGLRSHHSRAQKADDHTDSEESKELKADSGAAIGLYESSSRTDHVLQSPASFKQDSSAKTPQTPKPAMDLALATSDTTNSSFHTSTKQLHPVIHPSGRSFDSHRDQLQTVALTAGESPKRRRIKRELANLHDEMQNPVYEKFATEFGEKSLESTILRRSKSALHLTEVDSPNARLLMLPRHLSFSAFDESLRSRDIDISTTESSKLTNNGMSTSQIIDVFEVESSDLQALATRLLTLERHTLPCAEAEVDQVVSLNDQVQKVLGDLNNNYYTRLDEYETLQATSTDIIAREKASLNDGLRRIEMLGQKLDYELDALNSRMQEVEDGTGEFERNVLEIEARVSSLIKERHNDSGGIPWLQRLFNFFSK